MTDTASPRTATLRTRLAGASLGEMTGLLEQALLSLPGVGDGAAIASLASDVAATARAGDAVTVTATVDRATRTLVFARADLRRESDETLLLAAQAVLKAPIR